MFICLCCKLCAFFFFSVWWYFCVCSCGKDAAQQLVDHGRPDASLPADGGGRHGVLDPVQEEQGHLQNWRLQELQNALQGKTVRLCRASVSFSALCILFTSSFCACSSFYYLLPLIITSCVPPELHPKKFRPHHSPADTAEANGSVIFQTKMI